jgi:hypothetical protein
VPLSALGTESPVPGEPGPDGERPRTGDGLTTQGAYGCKKQKNLKNDDLYETAEKMVHDAAADDGRNRCKNHDAQFSADIHRTFSLLSDFCHCRLASSLHFLSPAGLQVKKNQRFFIPCREGRSIAPGQKALGKSCRLW